MCGGGDNKGPAEAESRLALAISDLLQQIPRCLWQV
jgi:hypothetical protein